MIRVKRVYDEPEEADGFRVLVDRLWPRGLSKDRAMVDLWLKEAAPSDELRRWFGHNPGRWPEFKERYRQEIKGKEAQLALILEKSRDGTVTLLYGAREQRFNNAVALMELLAEREKAG